MNMETKVLKATLNSLSEIRHERYFETERGFQAEFYCLLKKYLKGEGKSNSLRKEDQLIFEQESQKRGDKHGIGSRPDIIFHHPTRLGGDVTTNNGVVFELKLHAGPKKVAADALKLRSYIEILHYEQAVFVNIASTKLHLGMFERDMGCFRDKVLVFAIKLKDGTPYIRYGGFKDNIAWTEIMSPDEPRVANFIRQ